MKTKRQIINEVITACDECKSWYKEIADAGKFEKKGGISARVDIDDEYYIFIDCDQENNDLNYFWFSLERQGDIESIDEQDTSDTSKESIRFNIDELLSRNINCIRNGEFK